MSDAADPADDPASSELARPITRRRFLGTAGAAAAGLAVWQHAPYVHAKTTPTLRVLGTHVTLQEEIRRRAERDLGIRIEFEPGGSAEVLQKASTQPESFDLYEQWSNSLNVLWKANAIQAIDRRRLTHWSEINSLTKTGRLTDESRLGKGDAPYRLLYAQSDGTLSDRETNELSFLPYVHNVDSFGYDTRVVPEGKPYEEESWGWLLDDRWKGRVALVNEPTIGLFDAALAAEAQGLMSFADIGNPTRKELDTLFDILVEKQQSGHFNAVWSSVPHSVQLMREGRVVLQSMFSPAVSQLNGEGLPVNYAAPREGYRAWHGVMCLSAKTEGHVKDAAYKYMNWWLSGWPGAFIARQGYYISNPERAKEFLAPAEWNYWYSGKPATMDLSGTDGQVSVRAGETRRGGSYEERFSNVAVWNTVIDEYEYCLQRWYGFLTS